MGKELYLSVFSVCHFLTLVSSSVIKARASSSRGQCEQPVPHASGNCASTSAIDATSRCTAAVSWGFPFATLLAARPAFMSIRTTTPMYSLRFNRYMPPGTSWFASLHRIPVTISSKLQRENVEHRTFPLN